MNKESLPLNGNEISFSDTTISLKSAAGENDKNNLEDQAEATDKEDDTQHEMNKKSEEDSPQQNNTETIDSKDHDKEEDKAISRRNSTTSSQIDDKVIETVSKENSVNYLSRRVSREMDFLDSETNDQNVAEHQKEHKDDSKQDANDVDIAQFLPVGRKSSKVKLIPDLKNDEKSKEVYENKTTKVVTSRWKNAAKVAALKETNRDRADVQTPPNDPEDRQNNKQNTETNEENQEELKDKEDDDDNGIHVEKKGAEKKTSTRATSRWKGAAKNVVSEDFDKDRKGDQLTENDADDKQSNIDGEIEKTDKDNAVECVQNT